MAHPTRFERVTFAFGGAWVANTDTVYALCLFGSYAS